MLASAPLKKLSSSLMGAEVRLLLQQAPPSLTSLVSVLMPLAAGESLASDL